MMAAGVFNKPFELMPIAANRRVAGLAGALTGKNVHVFRSQLADGAQMSAQITAQGRIAFVDARPAVMPLATNEIVYSDQWVEALPNRPFLKAEMEALEARKSWAVPSGDGLVAAGKPEMLEKSQGGKAAMAAMAPGVAEPDAIERLDNLDAVYQKLDMPAPVAVAPRPDVAGAAVKLTEVIETRQAD